MAIDIVTLTGHQLSPDEIINLPRTIDTWSELEEIWHVYRQHKGDQQNTNNLTSSQWETAPTAASMKNIWDRNEKMPQGDLYLSNPCIQTFFGWVHIYRHTVRIALYPEHRYTNLSEPGLRKYILVFNRAIAKRFGQQKLVYIPDSAFPESEMENQASYIGSTLDEVIAWGTSKFGPPLKEMADAIENHFFVDHV